jgi:chromosome segregation ATPase
MQASLETESRQRAELARIKKKLESDINELEIALDHANKANSDAQKNLRRFQDQIKEVQLQIEDEQRQKDEAREQCQNAERRMGVLQQEKDELRHHYEETERVRKAAEIEAHDARDQANELAANNGNLLAAKRKCESELGGMQMDLDDTLNELKTADENAKKAMSDAARLAEELHQEQEHATHIERMRKASEQQIKDMQVRIDEAEQAALKGGKKTIAKLEARTREIESELDGEQRRHADACKQAAKADRHLHELQFQVDENKKGHEHLNDLVDKLQQKLKTVKRQVEEAEELATTNVQKYRQLQCALDDAEERADTAESNVSKVRSKSRTAMSVQPSASGRGISPSRSTVFRSHSRARAGEF